jgi:hypothetical protein
MKPTRSIADHYPMFGDAGSFLDAPDSWLGRIEPFGRCPESDLTLIVDDLRAGGGVLLQEGALLHDRHCDRDHSAVPFLDALAGIGRDAFVIRLIVWPRPVHPKVIAVYPEISSLTFPEHPHLFRNTPGPNLSELRSLSPELLRRIAGRHLAELPRMMPNALCAYRPGDGEWSWESGDLVDCLDYAALFLAKHAIWKRTAADRGGLWVGPQASHEPADMLNELDPNGECRCGRGRRYRDCCRPNDAFIASMKTQIAQCRPFRPAA